MAFSDNINTTMLSLLILSAYFLFSPAATSAAHCNADDREALLAIKAAFNNAYYFVSWVPSELPCCSWPEVRCDPKTGRVTGLFIFQDNLTGTIPTAIGSLPYLTELTLHHLPGLTGPIPPALATLTRLSFLIISYTSISGPVPSFLSSLSSLTLLDLSFNSLSGSIPDSLLLLPSLTAIHISRNHLTGPLPPDLFQYSPDDVYLRLSHNNLSGEVLASYSNINFTQINLSRNRLTGDATPLFGRWKRPSKIILLRNMFRFNLSGAVFPKNSATDPLGIILDHNMIYGSILRQIADVPGFLYLNVSYNRLCGPIPTGGQLGRFDSYCYWHNKCLCGTPLPPCH